MSDAFTPSEIARADTMMTIIKENPKLRDRIYDIVFGLPERDITPLQEHLQIRQIALRIARQEEKAGQPYAPDKLGDAFSRWVSTHRALSPDTASMTRQ